jgi:hypothetical protein
VPPRAAWRAQGGIRGGVTLAVRPVLPGTVFDETRTQVIHILGKEAFPMSESTELATTGNQAADVVTVQVLNAKTGQMVPARIPAAIAERFPSYGMIEEMKKLADEVFGEDGGNLSIGDLVRIKVPDGNSKAFTIGDEVQKTVRGIMILRQERRNFWAKSVEESGNQAPDCFSRDGVNGVGIYGPGTEGNPTGKCEACPLSQWSDIDGKRVPPPCHQQEAVLMLTEEMPFPVLVTVPRTSIKNFKTYWKNTLFMTKLKSLPEVVTEIGLSPTKNDANTVYNELTFTLAEDLTKGMARAEKDAYKLAPLALAEQFRSILVRVDTFEPDAEQRPARTADDEGGFRVSDDADDVAAEFAGQTTG